ncbi:RagB/SusD family nutrient uptake outer membrane protein [Chitinophaga vietnamensis]|uniref:RagB/SusD family nutrient uptake outer membrane protein n=1 Tax=Chitinophaga vietnamensis TaxID=2593957 RepID=UPI00117788FA|nr:RagB/SusD family nutrient uptake outer membrane protein [Chitinophaga vietnamensis]
MKKTHLFILGIMLIAGASCQKQLDLKPISNTISGGNGAGSAGSFIKDAATAESAMSACYSFFKNDGAEYYVLDYFNNGDSQSDNAYVGADNVNGFQIDEFRIVSTNEWVKRDWGYLYNHIARCNAVILNVPKVTDPALTQARKSQMIGEAKTLRARAFFDLVRIFGPVPLITYEFPAITPDNISQIYPQLYPARTTVDSVYKQIIQDLSDAATTVPSSAQNKGYVTPGVVYTLLAKVYAAYNPHDWAKVKENCDKVIALGYALLPEFEQLWDNNHLNSSEAIFELNFAGWETGGNWGTSMFLGDDWKKFCNPSNDMLKAYDDAGDAVRKASTITFMNVNGKWADKYLDVNKFPFFYKMRKTDGTQHIIMYRLADVLLLKAEALNELGDAAGAAVLVNQIRSRAHLAPTTATSQSDLRNAIALERRLELAFEGQRWFDLLRTNQAIPVMQAVKDGNGNNLGYKLNENKLLWPVPQGEMDLNPSLTQNPGY